MINKIVTLIDLKSDFEHRINAVLSLFSGDKGFIPTVEICYHIDGPSDWEFLSRSARNNYPDCKSELNLARERMDVALRCLREKGIKACKHIFISEEKPRGLNLTTSDLVLLSESQLIPQDFQWISELAAPIFIVPNSNEIPQRLNDLVLSSTFEDGLDKDTMELVLQLNQQSDFHLDFLFVNTKTKFESTKVSIDRIKKSIRESCMGKTHISVFNAESFAQGLNEFQQLKNCDLIVVEKYDLNVVLDKNGLKTPILFIP